MVSFSLALPRSLSLPNPRCDIGSGQWVRCNDTIQKACHYPVRGLSDSTIYQFRVCAVNQAGVGRPSKATEPVITTDPLEHTRTMGNLHTQIYTPNTLWVEVIT